MELYHETIVASGSALKSISGCFSHYGDADFTRQIVVAKLESIELYCIAEGSNKLSLVTCCQLNTTISNINRFLVSQKALVKSFIVVTMVSNRFMVLSFCQTAKRFVKLQEQDIFENQNTLGIAKPAIGQSLSVNDPHRLVCVASFSGGFIFYQIVSTVLKEIATFQTQNIVMCISPSDSQPAFYALEIYNHQNKPHKRVTKYSIAKNTINHEIVEELSVCTAHNLLLAKGDMLWVVYEECIRHKEVQIAFPKREMGGSLQINAYCKFKADSFLLSNEKGDILELAYVVDKGRIKTASITYFSTIAQSIHLSHVKDGIFFSVSECDNHELLRIEDQRNGCELRQCKYPRVGDHHETYAPIHNSVRSFKTIDFISNSSPVTDMKVVRGNASMNEIIVTTARNGKGTLNVYKHGLRVTELCAMSYQAPSGVWCVKKKKSDPFHSFVVMSFLRRTVTLMISHKTLTQDSQMGIDESDRTICFGTLQDDSYIQIQPLKIRHIRKDLSIVEIVLQNKVLRGAVVDYGRQVVVCLLGGYTCYYELDRSDTLVEIKSIIASSEACGVEFSIDEGNRKMLVVAQTNYSIVLYNLYGEGKILSEMGTHNMKTSIQSLVICIHNKKCLISVGLANGTLTKLQLSPTGKVENVSSKKCGELPVKLARISAGDHQAVLKIGSKASLQYNWEGKQMECSLALPPFQIGCQIKIPKSSNTFITHFEGYIRIIELTGFGELFHKSTVELPCSGRKILPFQRFIGVLQYDLLTENQHRYWVTQFEIYHEHDFSKKLRALNFENDQKCISLCYNKPKQKADYGYLCFGCVTGLTYHPYSVESQCIKVYQWSVTQTKLTLLHRFELDDLPNVLQSFNDKLIAGVGNSLRLYEFGKSKLLLKSERKHFKSIINGIYTDGEKIFVTEVMDSFSLYRCNKLSKSFDLISQDILPRYMTTASLIDADYGIMAGADKFCNIFVSRITSRIKEEFYNAMQTESGYQFRNSNKFESLVSYHIGEVVTAIDVGQIENDKSREIIFYATISGKIGILCPFESEERQAQESLLQLEKELRASSEILGGTNHKLFRAYYSPDKGVVDGDLCGLYKSLQVPEQKRIAQNLKLRVEQVHELLERTESNFLRG